MDAARGPQAHRPFEDMAVAHVLGGLDTNQGRVFRSHLLECSDCRARVGELRAIASDLVGVERDARREQSANAVETKRRNEEEEADAAFVRTRPLPRWVVVALLVIVVALTAYGLVVRGNVLRLEQLLEQRLAASAVLEHGDALPVRFRTSGVEVTAKVRADRVVVLIEGLTSGQTYGAYLVNDTDEGSLTVYSHLLDPREDSALLLLPLVGAEDRLIITAPEGPMTTEPDGSRVFEATLAGVPASSSGVARRAPIGGRQ